MDTGTPEWLCNRGCPVDKQAVQKVVIDRFFPVISVILTACNCNKLYPEELTLLKPVLFPPTLHKVNKLHIKSTTACRLSDKQCLYRIKFITIANKKWGLQIYVIFTLALFSSREIVGWQLKDRYSIMECN